MKLIILTCALWLFGGCTHTGLIGRATLTLPLPLSEISCKKHKPTFVELEERFDYSTLNSYTKVTWMCGYVAHEIFLGGIKPLQHQVVRPHRYKKIVYPNR